MHGRLKLGDITLAAYNTSASATDATGADVDATELSLMLRVKTGDFQLGFEYVLNSNSSDEEGTGIALGVKVGPIDLHWVSVIDEDATGTEFVNTTEIAAAFNVKISDQATLALGYAQRSNDLSGADETDTLMMVSAKSTF